MTGIEEAREAGSKMGSAPNISTHKPTPDHTHTKGERQNGARGDLANVLSCPPRLEHPAAWAADHT